MTTQTTKPTKVAPKAPKAIKFERTPVAKQAAFARQEGPGFDKKLASALPVVLKVDIANRIKFYLAAPIIAPEQLTRTFDSFNKGVPLPKLGSITAIRIIVILPILFATAVKQDLINLPAYGAFAKICLKLLWTKNCNYFL